MHHIKRSNEIRLQRMYLEIKQKKLFNNLNPKKDGTMILYLSHDRYLSKKYKRRKLTIPTFGWNNFISARDVDIVRVFAIEVCDDHDNIHFLWFYDAAAADNREHAPLRASLSSIQKHFFESVSLSTIVLGHWIITTRADYHNWGRNFDLFSLLREISDDFT